MSFRRSVLDARYMFEYDVGQWTFGTIQVLKDNNTGELKVCKTVQKNLIRNPVEAMAKLNRILDLQHKHLCGITDVLEDAQRIYVVNDKCQGGDVAEWIVRVQDDGNWLHEATVADYIRQTLIALVHVHGTHVCHRDLRPSSLGLTSKLPDATVKLCDCGLAEIFDPQNEIRRDLSPFAAPELLEAPNAERSQAPSGPLPGSAASGAAADVWSIGAIAHQLLVGSAPPRLQDDRTFLAALARVGNQAFSVGGGDADAWSDRSPLSRDFIRQVLRPLPGSRPSAAVALQHPWMQACVPLNPSHWKPKSEGVTELQNMMLCYMLSVLLLPDVIEHRDVFQLRSAFASADSDRDGFISRSTAQRLMRDRLPRSSAADIVGLFDSTDVMSTGTVDLCTFLAVFVLGTKFGVAEGQGREQKTALLAQRLVPAVFESYGDPQRMVVSVASIQRKLSSPVVREIEQHAEVNYDELLDGFPEDSAFDAEALMATLLEHMGRGTPLAPLDSDTERDDSDAAWSDRLGLDSLQELAKGIFQTCALSGEKKRGHSRLSTGRLGGM